MTGSCVLLTNPEHAGHLAPGHPERPQRVDAILDAIAGSDLGLVPAAAPEAPAGLISRVHDPAYLAVLEQASAAGGGWLDPDTYLTPSSMPAARTATGGVVEGVRRVVAGESRSAFAVIRPPGHHAETARAMGFCLFNNVAVAVIEARQRGINRVAVIDFDVHHGNGTQHTFSNDPDLLYVSTHQYPFYPGTGGPDEQTETTLNLPLQSGSGDKEFLSAYERKVGPAVDRFAPELLLVSAGFDAHADDPIAGLRVSTAAYGELAQMIRGWADQHAQGRSVWALEGGYNLDAIGQSVVACLRVLLA